ncbi:hypothetical protein CFP71_30395 [Amycolatopsis thailandensis]|uniref:Uncharacterized protein n=1 Tax=Amycolatopsis thailandensis TaxID=589330 RepID=A0A229RRY7_9PSEU|nr:hypothetical protein [Amycolatopsis thailandensis]OXM49406.1 hypothetical protein CFP71_30395 [Amycolatopsis thailandensis]
MERRDRRDPVEPFRTGSRTTVHEPDRDSVHCGQPFARLGHHGGVVADFGRRPRCPADVREPAAVTG